MKTATKMKTTKSSRLEDQVALPNMLWPDVNDDVAGPAVGTMGILDKLIAANPRHLAIEFNAHWTCYSPNIDAHSASYRETNNWVSDKAHKDAMATGRVWEIKMSWDEPDSYETIIGSDLIDVLKGMAKRIGVEFRTSDLEGNLLPAIHAVIGDRIDTHLSMVHQADEFACFNDQFDTVTLADREAAYRGEKFWSVAWYPHTPVGLCYIRSVSLEAALRSLAS